MILVDFTAFGSEGPTYEVRVGKDGHCGAKPRQCVGLSNGNKHLQSHGFYTRLCINSANLKKVISSEDLKCRMDAYALRFVIFWAGWAQLRITSFRVHSAWDI